jgi:O-antigen ligase
MIKLGNGVQILTTISVFFAVFFLPIKTGLSNAGVIGIIITTIFSFIQNGLRSIKGKTFLFYGSTSWVLYLPYLAGAFYTSHPENIITELTRGVFFLLLPFLILRKDLNYQSLVRPAIWGLVIGSIVSAIFLLANNFYNFSISDVQNYRLLSYDFTGRNFVEPLREMHPVYLGSYYLFAGILLWETHIVNGYWKRFGITILFLLTIFFLNTRIIALLTLLCTLIIAYRKLSHKGFAALVLTGILVLLIFVPLISKSYVFNKFYDGTRWELEENVGTRNTDSKRFSDSRMSRWKVSWTLYEEKPVFGHGTGSARELLVESYLEKDMKASLKQKYDSHNQFLAYAIEFGLIGLLSIFSFFFCTFWGSISQKQILTFYFATIVFVICFTENYLNRNMGISFVAIWSSLLHWNKHD